MTENYYREKLISLVDKLFLDKGNAKSRFINCQEKIFTAYLASSMDGVPVEIKNHWIKIWEDLNKEPDWKNIEGEIIISSYKRTLSKKRNKSLEKYLLFFQEEYYRVL